MNSTATFKIINPGLYTTIQDLGRFGYQQYGMPVSGAMDTYSLRLANKLVGNDAHAACMETTFLPPHFEIISDTIMAITGGQTELTINNISKPIHCNHHLKAGDMIQMGPVTKGSRVYIAFAGGIDVPVIMNSRSTYARANVGGFNGRKLLAGDEVFTLKKSIKFKHRSIPNELLLDYNPEQEIRVIGGSEMNRFSFEGIKTFLTSTYTISNKSDRMGYRLDGPEIKHKQGADIISSGICNGAIQVPGDGKPIVMLADRQTVGGYTKIANVITADLPLFGQLKPSDKIYFTHVKLDYAHKILKEREKLFRQL